MLGLVPSVAWPRALGPTKYCIILRAPALRYLAAPLVAMSSSFKNEDELVVWLGKRFPVIGGGVCVTLISSRFTISP